MNGQEKLDKKIVVSNMKGQLQADKKRVKHLKRQIRTLQKKLKSCNPEEMPIIEGLITDAQSALTEISTTTTNLLVQLISFNKHANVSQRIVKKMGYETVEGFLNTYGSMTIPNYAKDYAKGFSGTITYGDDPSALIVRSDVAKTLIPEIADISMSSSKKGK